jgi:glycosidase
MALVSLPILAAVSACASEPTARRDAAQEDGGREADGGRDEADAGADAGPGGDAGLPPKARWGRRRCSVTIRFTPRPGARSVLLAGDFTSWGSAPLPMSDPDGDGVYTITVGPENGLVPGRLHAYRIIVDGEYVLDPRAAYRKYDGDCINSGLLAPACDAGPEIVPMTRLVPRFDAATRTGAAEVRVAVLTAVDGSAPADVRFALDGAPLPAGAVTLDADAGAYDVRLSDLPIGRHVLSVRARDTRGREAEPIDLPFWIEETPFEWRDGTMYMVVVDRFANGTRASDAPVGAPVAYPADFHGGDLVGLTQVIREGYLDELGINVLWLSPIQSQAEGHFEGREDGRRYAAYHGYWPKRGRAVEPRFGGSDALRELVEEAHRHGIRVLLDLINNQVHEQHEYYRAHPDWFRTGCVCGIDPGCGWSERPLDCLFARYLPDINWRVPAAEAQFIADALSWIEEYGIDGFRIDAVKHVETSAVFNLRAAIARRFERAGYRHYLVGETAVGQWDAADYGCGERFPDGYAWLDAYVGPHALDGQFDFPSHHRLGGLVDGTMGFDAVEAVVRDAQRRYRPDGLHVNFLGTHDTSRMASRAAMDPRSGCRWPEGGACSTLPTVSADPAVYARLRRAFTVLYTMPGIPFLYYGDEIAMPGGNDPDNRRDMMFDGALAPLSMSSDVLTPQQRAMRDFLRALGRARRESDALRRGRRIPLIVEDDTYVVAWAGEHAGDLAVVAVTRGGALTGRAVDGLTSAQLEGVTRFEAAAGTGTLRRSSGDRLLLDVPAGEAAIFVAR